MKEGREGEGRVPAIGKTRESLVDGQGRKKGSECWLEQRTRQRKCEQVNSKKVERKKTREANTTGTGLSNVHHKHSICWGWVIERRGEKSFFCENLAEKEPGHDVKEMADQSRGMMNFEYSRRERSFW